MQVTDPHRFNYKFNNDIVEKLFLRFKNLEKITVRNILCLFEGHNDCRDFSTLCPKLETFEIESNQRNRTQYYAAAWTLRHLLTTLNILDTKLLQENYGGTAQFISCFPRIRSLSGDPPYLSFGNFEDFLPVFEHLEKLTSLSLKIKDDDENFAENFLATKIQDTQDHIVKRLSQVLSLECRKQEYFCVNSIKFVSKYLTGLQTITIGSHDNEELTEVNRQAFCNNLLDIICSAKLWAHVYMSNILLADLSSCLPAIMDKIFCQTSSAHRLLHFEITNIVHYEDEMTCCNIETSRSLQKLEIFVKPELSLEAIITDILDKIDNIDELIFVFDHNSHRNDINVDAYDAILEKLPSLKQITLDISKDYQDKDTTSRNIYPLIEAVTLRISSHQGHQKLFDRCSFAFPNLKQLDLDGYWYQCRVGLSSFTLEILELDITDMIEARYDHEYHVRRDMFVILEDINKRHVFKVHESDLSSISVVHDSELDDLVLEDDYIQMHVTIHSLLRLEIYARVHDHLKSEKLLVRHVFTLT